MLSVDRWLVNPGEITQHLQSAAALHNKGELDQAEAIYRKVLSVDANNFYALRFLGCLCRLKGAYVEGIDVLQQCFCAPVMLIVYLILEIY